MALRLSTGLRDKMLEKKAQAITVVTGTDISFGDGDGTGGRDTINQVANGLAGYEPGKLLTVVGSTLNDGTYEILSSAPGIVEVAAGSLNTEAAAAAVVLVSASGGSLTDLFRNCVMRIYTGSQPTSPNDAATGTLLVEITESSGTFTAGQPANGLNFGDSVNGVIGKASGETWSGQAGATGTAGWFRIFDNAMEDAGSISTTAPRIDGAIATSGAQLNMSNTSITSGGTTTIDTVAVTLPAS